MLEFLFALMRGLSQVAGGSAEEGRLAGVARTPRNHIQPGRLVLAPVALGGPAGRMANGSAWRVLLVRARIVSTR